MFLTDLLFASNLRELVAREGEGVSADLYRSIAFCSLRSLNHNQEYENEHTSKEIFTAMMLNSS